LGEPGGERVVAAAMLAQAMQEIDAPAMGPDGRPVLAEQELAIGHPPTVLVAPDLAHRLAPAGRRIARSPPSYVLNRSRPSRQPLVPACARPPGGLSPPEDTGASASPVRQRASSAPRRAAVASIARSLTGPKPRMDCGSEAIS